MNRGNADAEAKVLGLKELGPNDEESKTNDIAKPVPSGGNAGAGKSNLKRKATLTEAGKLD